MPVWDQLVELCRSQTTPDIGARTAALAQWMLASDRGTSELATKHNNFANLRFRARMASHAAPVDFGDTDGTVDTYCKFASVDAFVDGYWHFIESGPYDGWRQNGDNGSAFVRHLAARGYSSNPDYVDQVLAYFAEADSLLRDGVINPGQTGANEGVVARLAVVVGHNTRARGASSMSPLGRLEYDFNSTIAGLMRAAAPEYNIVAEVFVRDPSTNGYTAEITDAYAKVHEWQPDCAIELHFNSSPGGYGTETLHRTDSEAAAKLAGNLQAAVVELLQLRSRGLKPKRRTDRGAGSLYALDDVPTVIVEPFFGDSLADCNRMAIVGEKALARAYLRGVRDWAIAKSLGN